MHFLPNPKEGKQSEQLASDHYKVFSARRYPSGVSGKQTITTLGRRRQTELKMKVNGGPCLPYAQSSQHQHERIIICRFRIVDFFDKQILNLSYSRRSSEMCVHC